MTDRARRWQIVLAAAAIALVGGTTSAISPAHAEPMTVPFVDRLGCGSSDAALTPILGYSGNGVALEGGEYSPQTAHSAYAGVTGLFTAASAGAQYTTYSPLGYGAETVLRGVEALGFPSVTAGTQITITLDLTHAQALAFTVGGIDSPSLVDVSASNAGSPVSPNAAAHSTTAGSASVSLIGQTARVQGATSGTSDDAVPEKAVDIWFPSPVDRLTFRVHGSGSGVDGGFLVTPPVACQAGAVTLTSPGPGAPTVDADAGRVAYRIPLSLTVTSTADATGAALYPAVSAPLGERLAASGIQLDGLTAVGSAPAACALAPDAANTAVVLASSAALIPGESCTLELEASVSMPQSTSDRTVTLDSRLASSPATSSRQKAVSDPLELTFPGVASGLRVTDASNGAAKPAETVPHTTTIVNEGPGAALDVTASIQIPEGATISGIPSGCSLGAALTCEIGALAPGASTTLSYQITVPSKAAPGTALVFQTSASASTQLAAAVGEFRITVAAGTPSRPSLPARPPSPPRSLTPDPPTSPSREPATPPPAPAPPAPAPPVTAPTGPPAATMRVTPLGLDLKLRAPRIAPGTAATLRGTLGPNDSPTSVTVTLTGAVGKGMAYRMVDVAPDGECTVTASTFSCAAVLEPGATASVTIRLYADALNAPQTAIQQLRVASDVDGQANASTVSIDVGGSGETGSLASTISTFNITTFPGAFVILLAMLLYALAAAVARRGRAPAPAAESRDMRTPR